VSKFHNPEVYAVQLNFQKYLEDKLEEYLYQWDNKIHEDREQALGSYEDNSHQQHKVNSHLMSYLHTPDDRFS